MRLRVLSALVVLAMVPLVAAASAQSAASARARAAVVTGTLGTVAALKANGDEAASRSAPSSTPNGVQLDGGSVSVSSSRAGGNASANAEAQAAGVDLLDGAVTATAVRRTATDSGSGVRYAGTVRGLKIGGAGVTPVAGRRYPLPDGSGYVVASALGRGLELVLTAAHGSFPAGTDVVIADVSAHARDAVATPTPTATRAATPTLTPTPTATPRATRTPKPKATSKPCYAGPQSPEGKPRGGCDYKQRLMSRRFVFPVRGSVTIGGPFGGFRADTGFHEGNDIFANFGTPVVAVADGKVHKVGSLPISGNRLWVVMDNGDSFFYAHLSAFSPAAVTGAHVTAGTVLGYVGNTGDAEPTPPHLHFEIHPLGGAAVDPHAFLEAWLERAGNLSAVAVERPGALVEVRDFIGSG